MAMPIRWILGLGLLVAVLIPYAEAAPQTEVELGGLTGDAARDFIIEWWSERRVSWDSIRPFQETVDSRDAVGALDQYRSLLRDCQRVDQEIVVDGLRTVVEIPGASADELFEAAVSWAMWYFTEGTDRIEVLPGSTPRLVVTGKGKSRWIRCPAGNCHIGGFGGYTLIVEAREGRTRITIGGPMEFASEAPTETSPDTVSSPGATQELGIQNPERGDGVATITYREQNTPGDWELVETDGWNSELNVRGPPCLAYTTQYSELHRSDADRASIGGDSYWTLEDSFVFEYAETIGRLSKALQDAVIW